MNRVLKVQRKVGDSFQAPSVARDDVIRFGHTLTFTGDTVTEMYSHTQPGQVAGKRLRVARQPSSGQALTADLNAS